MALVEIGLPRCDFLHAGEPDLVTVSEERPLAVAEYLKGRIRAFRSVGGEPLREVMCEGLLLVRDPTLPALTDLCRVPSGVSLSLWCIENIR